MGKRRKMNADHVRPRNMPAPSPEALENHLNALLSPLVSAQLSYYRQLGLRERILGLPLMVATVLTLIWRQVPSVHELNRLLAREDLLWAKATTVTQQALSQRFLGFPADVFERVLLALVDELAQRWRARTQRPLPPSLKWATTHFERVWIVDGSSLEALFKKLKSLQDVSQTLGGKIYTIVDGCTHLPVQVKFEDNPYTADPTQWEWLREAMPSHSLLLMDRGFYDFAEFDAVVNQGSHWITRLKKASFRVLETFSHTSTLLDQVIRLGHVRGNATPIVVRLIKVRHGNTWYSYITSVTDPTVLPPYVVADLYAHRWQIETAFNLVKRLLGLSYLWTGSINGIKLQIWATWLFYAVLLDLCDAVANELMLPTERISVEMVFRGLYHFHQAYNRGQTTNFVTFLCDPDNRDLGVVKQLRKARQRAPLNLAPFPT